MHWNNAATALTITEKGIYTDTAPCSLSIIYTNHNALLIHTGIPEVSVLSRQFDYNYCNSYLTSFKDATNQVQPEDLAIAFMESIPAYARILLCGTTSRNIFTINTYADQEVVLTLNRKHFCLNISLLLNKPRKRSTQKNAVLSTTITLNTVSGQFYFTLLKPLFEKLIPVLLKHAITRVTA